MLIGDERTRQMEVNLLKIKRISLEKNPYNIKYKETLQDFIDFEAIDLTPTDRKGRSAFFKNLPKEMLYPNLRLVSIKRADMMDLLPFISLA
ncbi:hypothetical protein AVEN_199052-1 [Araneus ventricosus]|uniref:Uncharacterized protein n=1 Tax=Araneus ventricosus TaxID=182803 RepID=A0A4Y2RQP6_ARAVE|nr:hypothetical protein AVEN_63811-1 [Araneus ventricosus]GBN78026.1 hypothetical protein AVEN_199052-1 [Araneus ventricosus]